uniref:Uncharacterized protein TCIL3000_8_150 n=1 Tax=Trypanosoma congolense (strain IL3000) TaxID=1068625 RepID=G0UR04_TRYCI|nr:unnamed protein product [Trypanosoma congolense IL3000]
MSLLPIALEADVRAVVEVQRRVRRPALPLDARRAPRPRDCYASFSSGSSATTRSAQAGAELEEELRFVLHAAERTKNAAVENDIRQVFSELQRRRRARKAVMPPKCSGVGASAAAPPRPHVLALVQACESSTEAAAEALLRSFYESHCGASCKDISFSLVSVPLARLLLKRGNSPADLASALKILDGAVSSRHVGAMLLVGLCLRDGVGVAVDFVAGLTWVERAADAGYAPAMYEMAIMYEDGAEISGKCLPSDWGEAMKLYRKAADLGHTMAQLNLGKLLWRAAEAAVSEAQGVCSAATVAELRGKSRGYLEAAAASGNEEAVRLLRCK